MKRNVDHINRGKNKVTKIQRACIINGTMPDVVYLSDAPNKRWLCVTSGKRFSRKCDADHHWFAKFFKRSNAIITAVNPRPAPPVQLPGLPRR